MKKHCCRLNDGLISDCMYSIIDIYEQNMNTLLTDC